LYGNKKSFKSIHKSPEDKLKQLEKNLKRKADRVEATKQYLELKVEKA